MADSGSSSASLPRTDDYGSWPWEGIVNVFSDGTTGARVPGGSSFPAVVDRAAVVDPAVPWLQLDKVQFEMEPPTDRQLYLKVDSRQRKFDPQAALGNPADHWTPNLATGYLKVEVAPGLLGPSATSTSAGSSAGNGSAWAAFHDNAAHIFSSLTPVQADGTSAPSAKPSTTDPASFDRLERTLQQVQTFMNGAAGTVAQWKASISATDNTVRGSAAYIMWHVLDNVAQGVTGVAGDTGHARAYLVDARKALQVQSEFAAWIFLAWHQGSELPVSLQTGIPGLSITAPSVNLHHPVGALIAVLNGLVQQNSLSMETGGIVTTSALSGSGVAESLPAADFWNRVQVAAKGLWSNHAGRYLDNAPMKAGLQNLAEVYASSARRLRPIAKPRFARVTDVGAGSSDAAGDLGGVGGLGGAGGRGAPDWADLVGEGLGGLGLTGPGGSSSAGLVGSSGRGGGSTDLSGLAAGNAAMYDGLSRLQALVGSTGSGPPTFAGGLGGGSVTSGNASGLTSGFGSAGAGATNGYLVPGVDGTYKFMPGSAFSSTAPAPAGSIAGYSVTGGGGAATFVPSASSMAGGGSGGGTAGYLVPDGSGGYHFVDAARYARGDQVPAGAIGGYLSNSGGSAQFVPSSAGVVTSSGSNPLGALGAGVGNSPTGSHLTAGAGWTNPTAAAGTTGAATSLAGAAAGTTASGPNAVPLYPPTAGGMGGGATGQEGERERSTWLAEDAEIWGTSPTAPPAVLGWRDTRQRVGAPEEEFDHGFPVRTDAAGRPVVSAGAPAPDSRADRADTTESDNTAGIGYI